MRKWPRFHWYETAGNCSNRRPRFEVPPVRRLTVTRGYVLGYPKRRPRGLSLGSPCVGRPGNPYLPPPPLVSCLLSRCGGRASRRIARVASRKIHGFLSLSPWIHLVFLSQVTVKASSLQNLGKNHTLKWNS